MRNIGVFAHVDAGKTTLTERMLLMCGAIRTLGAVDKGTAHTDSLDVERRRGITVRATCVPMTWNGVSINLIDTPGHTDFAGEVERALWALDAAVLIISAAEGIRPQTERLYRAVEAYGLPFIIFINKCDYPLADGERTIADARAALSRGVVSVDNYDQITELACEYDESMFADYVNGIAIPREALDTRLRSLTLEGKAHPALCGSALRGDGVGELLDLIGGCLPQPSGDPNAEACGVIFAVDNSDLSNGRAAYVRLFEGTLRNRGQLTLDLPGAFPGVKPRSVDYKITQIRGISLAGRGQDLGELRAGGIASVLGIKDARAGQLIGDIDCAGRKIQPGAYDSPLLLVKVTPADPAKREALRLALETLASEDPLLKAETLGGEPHVRVMGAVQLEVLDEWLRVRFGVAAVFGKPHIIHHETIARPATGFYAYTMPKPCWAVIRFDLEPLPRGSGIRYESAVPSREIMPRYQHQIEQALPSALAQGMLGWPVDDVRITLTGGEHHLIHTHPLDFIVATPVALMDGLRRAGTVLLEPILALTVTTPSECHGRIQSEFAAMRGEIVETEALGELVRTTGCVPMAAAMDFHTRLAALTGGRGAMTQRLDGYRERAYGADDPDAACPRRGVNPLDTAKYILAARSALDGGIFD